MPESKPPTPAPFRLRGARVAPPGWPADVSPNQVITAAHINAIRDSAYAWPGDVDGQNHILKNVTLQNVVGVMTDPTTTAGDLIARGASALGRLAIGAAGQVLTVDLALPNKLKWATPAAVPVASVFGRTGAIVATAGDYTAAQITNAVSTAATYADPAWLTSFGWSKLVGVPTTFPPAAHTHDAGAIVSGVVAPARLGTGVADATVYLRGDGTWAAVAGGGGGSVTSVFGRAGTVVAQAGDYTAAQVTGAVADPTLATGDLIVRNNIGALVRLPPGATGQVLTADTSLSVGMKWTSISAAVQTPWVTNIDGAGFRLVNVSQIAVAKPIPGYALDVTGDINFTGTLRQNGTPVSFGGSQTPWTSDIDAAGFRLTTLGGSNKDLIFAPNAAERVRIMAGGNVGINVSSPQALLHGIRAGNTEPSITYNSPAAYILNNAGVEIAMGCTATAPYPFWMQCRINSSAAQPLSLNPLGGNVGIGTTAPGAKLDVAGSIRSSTIGGNFIYPADSGYEWWVGPFTDAVSFQITRRQLPSGASWAVPLTITTTGSVGIGTTGPNRRLSVTSPNGIDGIEITNLNRSSIWFTVSNGANYNWLFQSAVAASDDFHIFASAVGGGSPTNDVMVLKANGDCNITGRYLVNGTPIGGGGGITTQNAATGKVANTVYQNTTGKELRVAVTFYVVNGGACQIACDSSSNPSTVVGTSANFNAAATNGQIVAFVLPNYYYKIITAGGSSVQQWVEWN